MNTLTFTPTTVSIDLGGTPISIETGRIAKQANGSVIVRQGGTMVLVAVCRAEPREGIDFFPLTVDYREPGFSAGKIPGGWFKREGKQTTKETLTSRLIDRPLRPLFEEGYNGDTMITVQVISFDGEHQPDTLGMVGRLRRPDHLRDPLPQPRGRRAGGPGERPVRGQPHRLPAPRSATWTCWWPAPTRPW